jgi:hypothetical protein
MVVGFIAQTFSFRKEVLPAFIQRHVEKILAQTTQSRQGIKLLLTQSSKLIFLGGVHINTFRDKSYFTAKSKSCKALDSVIVENARFEVASNLSAVRDVAVAPFYLLVRSTSLISEARGIRSAH